MSKPPTRAQLDMAKRLPQTQDYPWSSDYRYNQKRALWARCAKCGENKLIAHGFVAEGMERRKLMEILITIGWKIAPQMLCEACRPKMTEEEQAEGERLMEIANECGDGADIEDLKMFCAHMEYKYGAGVLADPRTVEWYSAKKNKGRKQQS